MTLKNPIFTLEQKTKQDIQAALQAFQAGSLVEQALSFFDSLGYQSDLQMRLDKPTAAEFEQTFSAPSGSRPFDRVKALTSQWRQIDILFQFGGEQLKGSSQLNMFSGDGIDTGLYKSFLFFVVELAPGSYTRSQLAEITREINRLFSMPVSVLFKYGHFLTISIVTHRPHRQDSTRDVLEKVTLIKDIDTNNPHRAHLEILYDLSLPQLIEKRLKTTALNFDRLQEAWKQTLDSSELNKRFFREVADWYFWASDNVAFPIPVGTDGKMLQTQEVANATSLIRLLTRLIFVWFLKEKNLIPDKLFNRSQMVDILKSWEPEETTYYKAILQNLFFGTLNQEMNTPAKTPVRAFRRLGQNFNATSLYRYEDYFRQPNQALRLFENIPFLNGGLFECLDKPEKDSSDIKPLRIDGFSDRTDNPLSVPNRLFFSEKQDGIEVDLSKFYGGTVHRKVRGLIDILDRYKFTITENTPVEEEIALDPELLGKVFENLLAYYNPETQTTARKQTGSFYTPREIVNYMVDESLLVYLKEKLTGAPDLEERLRHLFAFNDEPHHFNDNEVSRLILAIDRVKVLDPACGSGAFPMGVLQRMVTLLQALDPHNIEWKQRQLDRVEEEFSSKVSDETIASMKQNIELDFERNELDYGRKLYLIENCIYGVDIQPVAVQIAKLRCFISLIVEQRIDPNRPNLGVRPLPNLETKFVAANSLLGVERPQLSFADLEIRVKEEELAKIRRNYFTARTPSTKKKYRDQDKAIRAEIANLLHSSGYQADVAHKLAGWDPYDQNAVASFFDPEWMFNLSDGFDLVIGNPPYVRQEAIKEQKSLLAKALPEVYSGTADLYVYFYGRGFRLLSDKGCLAYISSNKWFKANYGTVLRKYIADTFRVKSIIDFGELPVFEAATFPMIFIAQKAAQASEKITFTQVKSLEAPYPDINAVVVQKGLTLPNNALKGSEWNLANSDISSRLERMQANGIPLEQYVNKQIYRGILTGFNTAFVIDGAKRAELIAKDPKSAEIIKPLALGDDVRKWRITQKDRWLIFTRRGINIENYPGIKEHLTQWKEELTPKKTGQEQKGRKPGSYKWFEIQDDIAYYPVFNMPKIVFPDISKESRFTFDSTGVYLGNTAYVIATADFFLLGILNSSSVWEYAKNKFVCLGDPEKGGRFRFIYQSVSKIPIPQASTKEKLIISELVQNCLDLRGMNCEKIEIEINLQVAKLYGL